MHVNRLAAIAGEEQQPVRATAQDRRTHFVIMPSSKRVGLRLLGLTSPLSRAALGHPTSRARARRGTRERPAMRRLQRHVLQPNHCASLSFSSAAEWAARRWRIVVGGLYCAASATHLVCGDPCAAGPACRGPDPVSKRPFKQEVLEGLT